jgi:dephospho-CoA kinase
LSAAEVRAIIGAQASRQARLAAADDVIHNDGNRDQLARQVLVLHDGYVDHVRMHCSANENAEKR